MRIAHILSIGNELLIGDIVNTNASAIGRMLTEAGFQVEQVLTLPDTYELLKQRITESFHHAHCTIVTGGLGPTHDDVTKAVLADLFDAEMKTDEAVLAHIKKMFEERSFSFSASNADQALVPESFEVLFNKKGTAPGLLYAEGGHVVAALPGVPYEMEHLMKEKVLPRLRELFPGQEVWATRYFKTAGVPESTLSDELIGDLTTVLQNGVEVAYLPHAGGVVMRVSTKAGNKENAEEKLQVVQQRIYERAKPYIYSEDRDTDLAKAVGDELLKQGLTIATAESCTGGMLSDAITNIPGCSSWMVGGVVAYSNDLKIDLLGVTPESLKSGGAVSREVALQMAKGIAQRTGAAVGVSTTGIAGPGGGSDDKPVGTVWMGFWINGDHFALKALFTKDRLINKKRTVMVVLETVRRRLLNIESYPYALQPHR
ncbi:MAG: competence/damage-inducible protein A [Balneolaceae bacterium]